MFGSVSGLCILISLISVFFCHIVLITVALSRSWRQLLSVLQLCYYPILTSPILSLLPLHLLFGINLQKSTKYLAGILIELGRGGKKLTSWQYWVILIMNMEYLSICFVLLWCHSSEWCCTHFIVVSQPFEIRFWFSLSVFSLLCRFGSFCCYILQLRQFSSVASHLLMSPSKAFFVSATVFFYL